MFWAGCLGGGAIQSLLLERFLWTKMLIQYLEYIIRHVYEYVLKTTNQGMNEYTIKQTNE